MAKFGIAEWFGVPFLRMSVDERKRMARAALKETRPPSCPFQRSRPPCSKAGGVCSIRVGSEPPVITCPNRFDGGDLLPNWLAEIVGFPEVYLATEVPFMRSPATGRAAGRVDLTRWPATGSRPGVSTAPASRFTPMARGSKKNGPQAIGKFRGGWNTRLHLVAADARTAVAFTLSPGNAHDTPPGRKLLSPLQRLSPQEIPGKTVACRRYRPHRLLIS